MSEPYALRFSPMLHGEHCGLAPFEQRIGELGVAVDPPFVRRCFIGWARTSLVKSDIRMCADWQGVHQRPVYTLGGSCPECGAEAVNSAPAPFSPEDPYGKYRRALKRRDRE